MEFEYKITDLTLLNQIDESHLLQNLKTRFLTKDQIYSTIGDVVVALNPYKKVDIYGEEYIKMYRGKNLYEIPPHIYSIADGAYKNMKEKYQDQCVLITGESGAGKTESSKLIMKYIASVSGSTEKVDNIKEQLLKCNPCLEAFGNAKTLRNDNSSRFGKYMDLQFDYKGDPIGGKITTYLLEKSRIISQTEGERTFHIFYQLIACEDEKLKESLRLTSNPDDYAYLRRSKCTQVEGIDDGSGFKQARDAFDAIGINKDDQKFLLEGVASVLHLGNITFKPAVENERASEIRDELSKSSISALSHLLGIAEESLVNALTTRTVKDNKKAGQDFSVPLDVEKATYSKDALAKSLYGRLFNFLVKKINAQIHRETKEKTNLIGVLDIYGFEVFQKNGFEQFCINYCNEKLQQLFIELTLKSEQEEYAREGLPWTQIEFFNNNIICDLIEAKNRGIFASLDEECMRPGDVTDMTFLNKLNATVIKHAHYDSREKSKSDKSLDPNMFRLKHYAGSVTYSTDGFIDKNNDTLYKDLLYAMNSSKRSQVKEMFPENAATGDLKRSETIGMQFRNSIQQLMENLLTKTPHYVRCLKPNASKEPNVIDDELVLHQCRYLGLLENIKVRRSGYCYRQKYDKFLQRYKLLSKKTWPNFFGPIDEGITAIMESAGISASEYGLGKTKIFIKTPKVISTLEELREKKSHDIASKIRAIWLGTSKRKEYLLMKQSSTKIKATFKMYSQRKKYKRQMYLCLILTKLARGLIARARYRIKLKKQPRRAATTIQNFWRTKLRRDFIQLHVKEAIMAAGSNWRKVVWPLSTASTKTLSAQIKKIYMGQMARRYRNSLSSDKKSLLENKVVCLDFCSKKATYKASIAFNPSIDYVGIEKNAKLFSLKEEGLKIAVAVDKLHRSNPNKKKPKTLVITEKALYVIDGSNITNQHGLIKVQGISISPFADNTLLLNIQDSKKGDALYSFKDSNHLYDFCAKLYLSVKSFAKKIISIQCQESFQANILGKTMKIKYYADKSDDGYIAQNTKSELQIHVKK